MREQLKDFTSAVVAVSALREYDSDMNDFFNEMVERIRNILDSEGTEMEKAMFETVVKSCD